MQGSFWVAWEVRGGIECGFALVLWVGCVRSVCAFRKCRLIPPHQSLTRQLPPEGKPSLRRANMANMAFHCDMPLRSALIRRLRCQTACSFLPPRRGRLLVRNTLIWTCFLKSRFAFCLMDYGLKFEALIIRLAEPTEAFPFKGEGVAEGDG